MTDARSRRRPAASTVPALAASALIAAVALTACSDPRPIVPSSTSPSPSWSVASPGLAGSETATGSGTGTGPGPGAAPAASQSTADAARDGVDPVVAALPARVRIRPAAPVAAGGQTRVTSPEGTWVISRPDLPGAVAAGYGELLLLYPDGVRIRRAYPFRGVPPQWLLVTPAAVYCGRAGTAALPDAMVCRIDRGTGQLRVRVLADRRAEPVTTAADVAGRPGRWVIDVSGPGADLGRPPRVRPAELDFVAGGGRLLRLDPDTLQVLGGS